MRARKIVLTFMFLFVAMVCGKNLMSKSATFAPSISCKDDNFGHYLFLKPIDLSYIEFTPKPTFENLSFLGDEGKYGLENCDARTRTIGIFMRALRFENITSAVEEKYGLPKYTLLTMLMQECNGINYLPNGRNDGGIGLIHMQPALATQFGLKTFNGCTDLVCFNHGKDLRFLITSNTSSPEKLIEYDDRFHPIINIDAAGRMMKYYSELKCIGKDAWDSAHKRYAGKYNYKQYTINLRYYLRFLTDEAFLAEVENEFNALNPNLLVDGQPADFKKFIDVNHSYNRNFELDKYQIFEPGNRP